MLVSVAQQYESAISIHTGFLCSSVSKESACSAGDPGSIPGLGRFPGEGNGNPLQYPCLENLMDRGAWWAAVHGIAKSQAQLSDEHLLTIGIHISSPSSASLPITPHPTPLCHHRAP